MAINSVSNRPVPSFAATTAATSVAEAAVPAAATALAPMAEKKNLLALPDGFEKRLPLGHGPVVNPREGGILPERCGTPDALPQDLGLPGELENLVPPRCGPIASPQQQVNDVAREALGDKLQDLGGKLASRQKNDRLQDSAVMGIGGPAAEAYYEKRGETKQVNKGVDRLLASAEKELAKGGTQNLARADRILDAAERAMDTKSSKEGLRDLKQFEKSEGLKGPKGLPDLRNPGVVAPRVKLPERDLDMKDFKLPQLTHQDPSATELKKLQASVDKLPLVDVPEL